MKDIVGKFSKRVQLDFDPFLGTHFTVKACLSLDKHRRLVGCKPDGSCLQNCRPSLAKVYDSQLLNDRSDLSDKQQLKDSAHVYPAAVKSKRLSELLDSWGAPSGLLPIQIFRNVWCHTCVLCIRTTLCLILSVLFRLLSGRNCGEGRCRVGM